MSDRSVRYGPKGSLLHYSGTPAYKDKLYQTQKKLRTKASELMKKEPNIIAKELHKIARFRHDRNIDEKAIKNADPSKDTFKTGHFPLKTQLGLFRKME